MIIRHRSWGENTLNHNCLTVKEFVENIIMNEPDKELKYFRICTTREFNGNANLLLYIQDGKIKSHHSTMKKFDWNDVIDWEIRTKYSMDIIKLHNILSLEYDCLEDIEKKFNGTDFKFDILSTEEKISKMFEDMQIKRDINGNCSMEDIRLCVKILVDENEELSSKVTGLEHEYKELEKENYFLNERLKWIGIKLGLE